MSVFKISITSKRGYWVQCSHHTPPPLKKVISSFRGWGPKDLKIHCRIVLLGNIMILQGVGHQKSCLGVCHANHPRCGGGVKSFCSEGSKQCEGTLL